MNKINNTILAYLRENAFLEEDVELSNEESLTGRGIIDSISLLKMIDYLEKEYSIIIPIDEITPENFDSLQGINKFISKILDKRGHI